MLCVKFSFATRHNVVRPPEMLVPVHGHLSVIPTVVSEKDSRMSPRALMTMALVERSEESIAYNIVVWIDA